MRYWTTLATVLLLLTTGMPAMACVSGSAMDRAESNCCRTMRVCDSALRQGCCRIELRTSNPVIAAQSPASHIMLAPGWTVRAFLRSPYLPASVHTASWPLIAGDSPPNHLSIPSTVLRI